MSDVSMTYTRWREAIERRRKALANDPTNVDLANSLWSAISGEFGYDSRRHWTAVEVFRAAMLDSPSGVVAYIRAMKEFGLPVLPQLLDAQMILAIGAALTSVGGEERELVSWFLREFQR